MRRVCLRRSRGPQNMEPLTTFSVLVGLFSLFRSERSGNKQSDRNDFLIWLEKSNHIELKSLLENNTRASEQLEILMKEDMSVIQSQLEKMNIVLSSIATEFRGFAELALAVNSDAILSEQSKSILIQFVASKGLKLLEVHANELTLLILDGKGGHIIIDDHRFVIDDLSTLVELGLLRLEHNSRGENLYIITRAASEFVKSMDSE